MYYSDSDEYIDTIEENGYDFEGYDFEGYDAYGFNRHGFDREGYSDDGRTFDGFDRDGFDIEGYNRMGFDEVGFDKSLRAQNGTEAEAALVLFEGIRIQHNIPPWEKRYYRELMRQNNTDSIRCYVTNVFNSFRCCMDGVLMCIRQPHLGPVFDFAGLPEVAQRRIVHYVGDIELGAMLLLPHLAVRAICENETAGRLQAASE